VSGHVHSTARISNVEETPNNRKVTITLEDTKWMKYVLPKGYIAVDGTSLTVGEVRLQVSAMGEAQMMCQPRGCKDCADWTTGRLAMCGPEGSSIIWRSASSLKSHHHAGTQALKCRKSCGMLSGDK